MKPGYFDISLEDSRARLGNVYWDVDHLVKGGLRRVLSATLNDVGKSVRAEGDRLIRLRYALKKPVVSKNFELSGANVNRLSVTFRSKYAKTGMHLSDFNMTQKMKKKRVRAVNVRVLQGKKSTPVKGGFVIKGRFSGKEILVKRTGKGRWPIKTLYGPNMHGFLNREENQAKLRAVAQARFEARFLVVAERLVEQAMQRK